MGEKKRMHWLGLLFALQQERTELDLAGKLTGKKSKELTKRERWLERQYEKAGGVFPVDRARMNKKPI